MIVALAIMLDLGHFNVALLGDGERVDHVDRIHQRPQKPFHHHGGQWSGIEGCDIALVFDGHFLDGGFGQLSGEAAKLRG